MTDTVRDELDRLFLRLVRAARDARPEYLSRAFEVADLLALVPYRKVRADLQVDTDDDYAHAMTRLLSGERGYVFADDLMQDDLASELASPNPDLAAYRAYLNAKVTLAQEHARMAMTHLGDELVGELADKLADKLADELVGELAGELAGTPATGASEPEPLPTQPIAVAIAPAPEAPADAPRKPRAKATSATPRVVVPTKPDPAPRPLHPDSEMRPQEARPGCRYCGKGLPEGREIVFCPSCGQNLRVRQCAACSAELEPEWKFCVTCGRAATT